MKAITILFVLKLVSLVSGTTVDWDRCQSEDQFCFGVSHYDNKTSLDGDTGCLARYDCTVFVIGRRNSTLGHDGNTTSWIRMTIAFNFMMIQYLELWLSIQPKDEKSTARSGWSRHADHDEFPDAKIPGSPDHDSDMSKDCDCLKHDFRNESTPLSLFTLFNRQNILKRFQHYLTMIGSILDEDVLIPPTDMALNHRFMFFKYDLYEDELVATLTDVPVGILVHLHGSSSVPVHLHGSSSVPVHLHGSSSVPVHLHGSSSVIAPIDNAVFESDVILFGKNKTKETHVHKTKRNTLPWWSVTILMVVGVAISACLIYLIDCTNDRGEHNPISLLLDNLVIK